VPFPAVVDPAIRAGTPFVGEFTMDPLEATFSFPPTPNGNQYGFPIPATPLGFVEVGGFRFETFDGTGALSDLHGFTSIINDSPRVPGPDFWILSLADSPAPASRPTVSSGSRTPRAPR
jgi:hypothetical protein